MTGLSGEVIRVVSGLDIKFVKTHNRSRANLGGIQS